MEQDHLFTKETLLLIFIGLLINFIGVRLALLFKLPIFLDAIGTILAGALGGLLPGIIVGFFSNAINSISDPITLYYGIISVLIGSLAAICSKRGVFRSFWKSMLSVLLFALIGGVIGSLLTWMLYGLDFGEGISQQFALLFYGTGVPKFPAQLCADVLIDLADKLITVLIVFFGLKLIPSKWMVKLPLGYCYTEPSERSSHG